MTDHEALASEGVPRSDVLCQRLAARVEPALMFALYGIIWALWGAGLPALAVLLGGFVLAGHPPPSWGVSVVFAASVITYVAAWVPFRRWAHRRRAEARRLFRDGTFVDATVGEVKHVSGRSNVTQYEARLGGEGGGKSVKMLANGHPPAIVPGYVFPALFVSGYRYCVAFPEGTYTLAKVR